jgi:hypothetical protein
MPSFANKLLNTDVAAETSNVFTTTTTRGHAQVSKLQDRMNSSKEAIDLSEELTEDIGSLLQSFVSRLPDPLISPCEIFHNALFNCITTPESEGDSTIAQTKLEVVRTIHRLLPTANLSLLVYLVSFLGEDARSTKMTKTLLFSWLFGRDASDKGRVTLDYLLENWDRIVEGLFAMDWLTPPPVLQQPAQATPPTTPRRRSRLQTSTTPIAQPAKSPYFKESVYIVPQTSKGNDRIPRVAKKASQNFLSMQDKQPLRINVAVKPENNDKPKSAESITETSSVYSTSSTSNCKNPRFYAFAAIVNPFL